MTSSCGLIQIRRKFRYFMPCVAALLAAFACCAAARAQSREANRLRESKNEVCREEKLALTVRGAISLVQISVNGTPRTFIVDSAGITIVNSDRVTLHVVEHLRTGPVTLSETAPLEPWNVVQIASLQLGREELKDVRILSRTLPHLEKQLGAEVDGVLGADLLTRWDAVASDYKHGALKLARVNCSMPVDEPPPAPSRTFAFANR